MDDNTLLIIILVCVLVFLLSFCMLYFSKIKQFFSWIKEGFKTLFSRKKGKKEKSSQVKKEEGKVAKSEIQTRPLLLPKSGDKKELELTKAEDTLIQSKSFSLKKDNKKAEFEREKEELKRLVELKNDEENVEILEDDVSGDDVEFDDEDEVILKKLEENSTVNVDGEDIDLNRLPLQIRRLLLSGILDKKEEE